VLYGSHNAASGKRNNATCMNLGHADLSSDRPWAYTHYNFSWILL